MIVYVCEHIQLTRVFYVKLSAGSGAEPRDPSTKNGIHESKNEKPNWISAGVVSQYVWLSLTRFSWILHGIHYSVSLGNTTNMLSPGHAVLCTPLCMLPGLPNFPNNLNFLFLTISSSVSYFPMCSPTLLCMSTLHGRRSMRGIMHDVWRQCIKCISCAFLVTLLARRP